MKSTIRNLARTAGEISRSTASAIRAISRIKEGTVSTMVPVRNRTSPQIRHRQGLANNRNRDILAPQEGQFAL
jgi:hypothetical protein